MTRSVIVVPSWLWVTTRLRFAPATSSISTPRRELGGNMGYSSERSSYGLRANGRSRKELIDRIVAEAQQIVRQRLAGMV